MSGVTPFDSASKRHEVFRCIGPRCTRKCRRPTPLLPLPEKTWTTLPNGCVGWLGPLCRVRLRPIGGRRIAAPGLPPAGPPRPRSMRQLLSLPRRRPLWRKLSHPVRLRPVRRTVSHPILRRRPATSRREGNPFRRNPGRPRHPNRISHRRIQAARRNRRALARARPNRARPGRPAPHHQVRPQVRHRVRPPVRRRAVRGNRCPRLFHRATCQNLRPFHVHSRRTSSSVRNRTRPKSQKHPGSALSGGFGRVLLRPGGVARSV
jgi:hypothetical protein